MMSEHWENLENTQSFLFSFLVFKNTKQFKLLHKSWASLILVGNISMEEAHALRGTEESDVKSRGKYRYLSGKRGKILAWPANLTQFKELEI